MNSIGTPRGDDMDLGYEDLEVGKSYGAAVLTVTHELLGAWAEISGKEEADVLPAAAWSVIVMPAVIACVGPRPGGNIHARQSLRIRRMPELGEKLVAKVTIEDKYEKRGRFYVVQGVSVRAGESEQILEASTVTVWPPG